MGWEGGAHNLFARVAIYGILAAMAALIPAAAGRRPAWMPAVMFSVVRLVLVAAAGLFYPGVPPSLRGLVQRFALLIVFVWMAATTVIARRYARLSIGKKSSA